MDPAGNLLLVLIVAFLGLADEAWDFVERSISFKNCLEVFKD